MKHRLSIAAVIAAASMFAAPALGQSFFPPTLDSTAVVCSSASPGMTVTVNVAGNAPAFYRPSGAVLRLVGGRLELSYDDGCGLLTVITPWTLTASLTNIQPGTYPIDALANPDGVTCAFTPLGPQQIGSVTVPPLPCAFHCLADVAGLGGAPTPDGQLTVDDVVVFLSAFFSNNLAIADVAGLGGVQGPDGTITPDDLVLFLSRFFGPCV
ncbi:MAG: GC-type dockerin domain-anchored protein [Phycisphaerales bacterium]